MPLANLMNQPQTVRNMVPGDPDGYGDEQLVLGTATEVVGYLEQQASVEFLIDRNTAVSEWIDYLPAGTVIDRLSQVTVGAQTFQVDGVPEFCYNPRTKRVSHLRVKLTVVNG